MIIGHAIFTDRANFVLLMRGCNYFAWPTNIIIQIHHCLWIKEQKVPIEPFSLPIGYDGGIPAGCILKRTTDHNHPFYIANNKQEWYKPKDDKLIFIEKVEEMKWSIADQFGAKYFPGCCHKPTSKLDAWLMINGKKRMEEFVNNTNQELCRCKFKELDSYTKAIKIQAMMQLITWHEFTNCAKLWSNDS